MTREGVGLVAYLIPTSLEGRTDVDLGRCNWKVS